MKLLSCLLLAASAVFACQGCQGINQLINPHPDQPYMTPSRMDRGLVIVLPGIEGRSHLNTEIVNGLASGGVKYAIEIDDWTSSWFAVGNLECQDRNRDKAVQIADELMRYKNAYPGRPVFVIGQSGGGAMAAWIAESMHGEKIDGIVMLAVCLSPGYELDHALAKSDRGIVTFYSGRDVVMLGLGTGLLRTMDGRHTWSAGMVGFDVPKHGRGYERLYQIPWDSKMAQAGNMGLHVTSGAEAFVAQYVAPFILAKQWDRQLMARVIRNDAAASPGASTD
jgi:hypothetical protein